MKVYVRCENCRTTADASNSESVGWIMVSEKIDAPSPSLGVILGLRGDEPEEPERELTPMQEGVTFCSADCLTDWASNRMVPLAERMSQ